MKRRAFAIFAAVVLLIGTCSMAAQAEGESFYSAYCYSARNDRYGWYAFLQKDNRLYVSAEDALALSGYDTYADRTYQLGEHRVFLDQDPVEYGGQSYYPLKDVMDALSVTYAMDRGSETLVFQCSDAFYEDLLQDCDAVLGNYDLNFLDGVWGVELSAVWRIVSGMRVDYLWGGYQTEQYQNALVGILLPGDDNLLELLESADDLGGKFNTLRKFATTDLYGKEIPTDLLSTDTQGILQAYKAVNDLIPGVSVGTALGIVEHALNAQAATSLYPKAVQYGLVENRGNLTGNLEKAVDLVYSYYDENMPTEEAVLQEFLYNISNGVKEEAASQLAGATASGISKLIGKKLFWNSAYVRLETMILDELFMGDATKAVEQTTACRDIQESAKQQIRAAKRSEDPMTLKYATILYLRACQYAFSLYAFDPDLSGIAAVWEQKAQEEIQRLCAYSDEALTAETDNEELAPEAAGIRPGNMLLDFQRAFGELYAKSLIYMSTNGDLTGRSIYRLDIDADGYDDWIVSMDNPMHWLIVYGNPETRQCRVLNSYYTEGSSRSFFRSSATGSLIVKERMVNQASAFGVYAVLEQYYQLADGQLQFLASREQASEVGDYDFTSPQATTTYSEGYEQVFQNLGELVALPKQTVHGGDFFQVRVGRDDEGEALLRNLVGQLPFVTGQTEFVTTAGENAVFFSLDPDPQLWQPAGVTVQSDPNQDAGLWWQSCAIVTQAGASGSTYRICDPADAMDAIAASQAPATILADGTYLAYLYAGGLQETADGLAANLTLRKQITLSDEYVQELGVGDVIPLSQYGYTGAETLERLQDLTITRWEPWGDETFTQIDICDDAPWLYKSGGSDVWYLMTYGDSRLEYNDGAVVAVIAPDAAITDHQTAYHSGVNIYGVSMDTSDPAFFTVKDIRDYFNYTGESFTPVQITVSGGMVTEILISYRP